MKSYFILGLLLFAQCWAADEVIKLTPFPITEQFDGAIQSFGEYADINMVIKDGSWSGAIRCYIDKAASIERPDETSYYVILYRSASDASGPVVRIVTWTEKLSPWPSKVPGQKTKPTSRELRGTVADAFLRSVDETELFSAGQGPEFRGSMPQSAGSRLIFGEEKQGGKTWRIFRDLDRSLAARAFVDAVNKAMRAP